MYEQRMLTNEKFN